MSAHERHVSSDSFILKIFIGHFCAWNGHLLNKEGMHRADTDRIHIYRNVLSIKIYELHIQILLEFYVKWMESKRLESLNFHKIWIWIVLHCPGKYTDMTSEDLMYPWVHDQTCKYRLCLYRVSLKYSYMSCMYYRLACITKTTNINKTHIHLSPQIIADKRKNQHIIWRKPEYGLETGIQMWRVWSVNDISIIPLLIHIHFPVLIGLKPINDI